MFDCQRQFILQQCNGIFSRFSSGNPLPAWVTTIQIDPSIDKGIGGCSDGMNIINPNVVHRHRTGHFETDGAKWAVRK